MIRIYTQVNGTFYDALLPYSRSFAINTERPKATRIALAGNAIHQTGPRHISTATPEYDADVKTDVADAVMALKDASSTCFLSDGKHLYESTIDAQSFPIETPGKMRLSIQFRIVRKIL